MKEFIDLHNRTTTRDEIQAVIDLAKEQNNTEVIYRLSKILNDHPDSTRFKLNIINYPQETTNQVALAGTRHLGDYREALDECGRLKKGWHFVDGKVVKVQKRSGLLSQYTEKEFGHPFTKTLKAKFKELNWKYDRKNKRYYTPVPENEAEKEQQAQMFAFIEQEKSRIETNSNSPSASSSAKSAPSDSSSNKNTPKIQIIPPYPIYIESDEENDDYIQLEKELINLMGDKFEVWANNIIEKKRKTRLSERSKEIKANIATLKNKEIGTTAYEYVREEYGYNYTVRKKGPKKYEVNLTIDRYGRFNPNEDYYNTFKTPEECSAFIIKTLDEKNGFYYRNWYGLSELQNKINELKGYQYSKQFHYEEEQEEATKTTSDKSAPSDSSSKTYTAEKFAKDLDFNTIKRSYSWISFDPDAHAERDIKQWGEMFYSLYNSLSEEAKKQGVLEAYNTAFDNGYTALLKLEKEIIATRSKTFSTAITGGAGITEKQISTNEKRMRLQSEKSELWSQKYDKLYNILEKIAKNKPVDQYEEGEVIKSTDTHAIKKLQDKIKAIEAEKDFIKRSEKAVKEYQRTNDFTVFSKYDIPDDKANEYIDQIKRFGYALIAGLNNRTAEIRRIKERIATLEKNQTKGTDEILIEGGKIVHNGEAQRLQIFFDGIPSKEVREALKARAFKWAPTAKAWQRTLTENAKYAVNQYLLKTGILKLRTALSAPSYNDEITFLAPNSLFGTLPEINTLAFKKMKVTELRAFTLEFYRLFLKGKKKEIEKHLKEVVFTSEGGRKIAYGEAMYSAKAAVIEHLGSLIKNSTYNNWGDRKPSDSEEILGYLNFKSKITIDGKKRHVRIAISVDKDRNLKFKSYDVGKKKSVSTHKGVKPFNGGVETLSDEITAKTVPNFALSAPRHAGILKEALTEKGKLKKGWYFQDYGIIDPKGKYHPLERDYSLEYNIIEKELRDRAFQQDEKRKIKGFEENKKLEEAIKIFLKELSKENKKYFKNNKAMEVFYWAFPFTLERNSTFYTFEESNPYINKNLQELDKYFSDDNELFERLENYETLRRYRLKSLGLHISAKISSFIDKQGKVIRGDSNKLNQKYGLSAPEVFVEHSPDPATQSAPSITPRNNSLANKMATLQNRTFETFIIAEPQMQAFLGDVERKTTGSTAITLTGGAGSGKTRFAFQFINALAQNYKVGHASLEEQPDSKLYFDKVHQYLDETAQANVEAPEIENMQDLQALIERNDVIVIDSFTKIREWDRNFLLDRDLRKKYNGKLFLIIFQQTSAGNMRGGSESEFDGDIILFTNVFPDYRENYIYPSKNRYNSTPREQLRYSVYYQQLLPDESSPSESSPATSNTYEVIY